LACGAVHALTEAGISIPEDVKIVGYDNVSASQYCTPSLSTIEQPVEEIGTLAANLFLKLQANEQKQYTLLIKLIRRRSSVPL
jgi:DNA-binding LacI/PurR family transcriptional regulator